jgi:two-component system chemotaxis response regulator CheY
MAGSGNSAHTQSTQARETFNALIVDDSFIMRRILKGCMEHVTSGTIFEAADGPETLKQIREHQEVQLVFLDWLLPHTDGVAVLKDIRLLRDKLTLPVIMVTTQASKDNVLEALKAGANHYIIKPFVQERVVEVVKATLAKVRGA